jgi:hypothetical protein
MNLFCCFCNLLNFLENDFHIKEIRFFFQIYIKIGKVEKSSRKFQVFFFLKNMIHGVV